MILTPLQRKALIQYNKWRTEPPGLGAVVKGLLPLLVPLIVTTVISAVFLPREVTWFVAGMGIGSILRQFAITRTTRRIVPVLLAIIDWHKLAALLGESAPGPERLTD